MNFQSDVHVCARSIQNYKQKIEEKKRSIDQLHRTLALLDVRIAKNQKNVHTLRVILRNSYN
jgi:peptidoglycan hydrolase CwlO-like protein